MTVRLPPDLESRVAEKARAEGISPEAYIQRVIREALDDRFAARRRRKRERRALPYAHLSVSLHHAQPPATEH